MKQTKVCNACHRELPLSDFHKDASSSDGHRYTCRACVSSYKKRMAIQRQENPEVSRYVPREGARMSSMQVEALLASHQQILKELATLTLLMREFQRHIALHGIDPDMAFRAEEITRQELALPRSDAPAQPKINKIDADAIDKYGAMPGFVPPSQRHRNAPAIAIDPISGAGGHAVLELYGITSAADAEYHFAYWGTPRYTGPHRQGYPDYQWDHPDYPEWRSGEILPPVKRLPDGRIVEADEPAPVNYDESTEDTEARLLASIMAKRNQGEQQ